MSKVKYAMFLIIGLFLILPTVVSAKSIEIKMDLTYKYKKDDFRVIYTDDSNKKYDVTRKATLNIIILFFKTEYSC